MLRARYKPLCSHCRQPLDSCIVACRSVPFVARATIVEMHSNTPPCTLPLHATKTTEIFPAAELHMSSNPSLALHSPTCLLNTAIVAWSTHRCNFTSSTAIESQTVDQLALRPLWFVQAQINLIMDSRRCTTSREKEERRDLEDQRLRNPTDAGLMANLDELEPPPVSGFDRRMTTGSFRRVSDSELFSAYYAAGTTDSDVDVNDGPESRSSSPPPSSRHLCRTRKPRSRSQMVPTLPPFVEFVAGSGSPDQSAVPDAKPQQYPFIVALWNPVELSDLGISPGRAKENRPRKRRSRGRDRDKRDNADNSNVSADHNIASAARNNSYLNVSSGPKWPLLSPSQTDNAARTATSVSSRHTLHVPRICESPASYASKPLPCLLDNSLPSQASSSSDGVATQSTTPTSFNAGATGSTSIKHVPQGCTSALDSRVAPSSPRQAYDFGRRSSSSRTKKLLLEKARRSRQSDKSRARPSPSQLETITEKASGSSRAPLAQGQGREESKTM